MNNHVHAGRTALLAISAAAAAIALMSGCSSDKTTDPSSSTSSGSSTETPTSSVVAPTTTAPSEAPSTSAAPATTGAQGPANEAPTTRIEPGGPSQTVSGGNSASSTTVRTPSPPTAGDLPGQNSGGASPGGNN